MSDAPQPDRLISFAQAAELLGVSKRTLERLVAAGEFPPPGRIGGKRVYPLSVVARTVQKYAEAC